MHSPEDLSLGKIILVNMKQQLLRFAPWVITIAALYFACSGIDWAIFYTILREVDPAPLSLGVVLIFASYLVRAARWPSFFPERTLNFVQSYRVLILGFLYNNILPARAGEIVRAHKGSKISGKKRTLVLATIVSERLADGLTLSVMFLLVALFLGEQEFSQGFTIVALLFAAILVGVIVVLTWREKIFTLAERWALRFESKASHYALDRLQVFVNGLAPLSELRRAPTIVALSLLTWFIELAGYYFITLAFDSPLSLSACVVFLVAVNFSSLIPSAPAGIGVIEAVATQVLVSMGIARELALSMVVTQHIIQFMVILIPGILIVLSWKKADDIPSCPTTA